MIFGKDHEALSANRVVTAHTPGGTAALRVAADFIHVNFPNAKVWLSDPTWPNHPSIFRAAGIEVGTYPYFDAKRNAIDFEAMQAALGQLKAGDVLLLHGCCHNPTGIDPTPAQWQRIAQIIEERNLLPLIDFAYQGLSEGNEEDAVGVLELCRPGRELLIASSFSKNFGLYNERVGALSVVTANPETAQKVLSQIRICVRTNYSNPPSHGGAIVVTILKDPALRDEWVGEVTEMRERINGMRHLFVETLKAKGVVQDFSFIKAQRGMFSFSGLTKEQVEKLRKDFAIYVVGSGRINVAGMTRGNMDALCEAIVKVL
jgi:aspartate/tyrosine/aromatic aminotransferase